MKPGNVGKILLICCALAVPVVANSQDQAAGTPELIKSVNANGGGAPFGGSLQMDATIGQPLTGQSSGGSFIIQAGFWNGSHGGTIPIHIFKGGFES